MITFTDAFNALSFGSNQVQPPSKDDFADIVEILGRESKKAALISGCFSAPNNKTVFDLSEKGKLVSRPIFQDCETIKGQEKINVDLKGKEVTRITVEFLGKDGKPLEAYLFTTKSAVEVVKQALNDIFSPKTFTRKDKETLETMVDVLTKNCPGTELRAKISDTEIQKESISFTHLDGDFELL